MNEWAASGARLGFAVDCRIKSERSSDESELEWTGGRSAQQVTVLEDPVYVTAAGEQVLYIPEKGGGWSMQLPRQKGQAGTLRLWLDLEESEDEAGLAAKKNDVTLDASDRLYLSAKCWRENDYQIGKRKMIPIQKAAQDAQDRVNARLSHESGDQRLDGKDALETINASIEMAVLIKQRDEALQALREAELILPSSNDGKSALFGGWPGTTEGLVLATGTVSVKRKKFLRDEFHIVGTWRATPVLSQEA